MEQIPVQSDQQPADAELITRYRGGDDSAAAELYARHHPAAWRLAVSIAGRSHADDLASEAFSRVLAALRNGHGPDVAFRAYLMTSVRHAHVNIVRRDHRYVWVEDYSGVESQAASDDGLGLRNESSLLARAFAALPERWQTVLWHTTIEQDSHDEVGRLLGISPTAVGALAYRAREGLRQGYLAAHLAETSDPACRSVRDQLPAYSRGQLSDRAAVEVESHLDGCAACTTALADLRGITSDLRALLAPALLGAAASATYLPTRRRPRLRRPRTPRSWAATGAAAATAAVVVTATTLLLSSGDSPESEDVVATPDSRVTTPTAPSPDEPRTETLLPGAITNVSNLPLRPLTPLATPANPPGDPGADPTADPTVPDKDVPRDAMPPGAEPTPEPTPATTTPEPTPEPEPPTTFDQQLTSTATTVLASSGAFDLQITSPDIAPVLTIDITSTGSWNFDAPPDAECTSTAGGATPTTVTCTFADSFSGTVSIILLEQTDGMAFTAAVSAENNEDPTPEDNETSQSIS